MRKGDYTGAMICEAARTMDPDLKKLAVGL
jgi:hypothetical protein